MAWNVEKQYKTIIVSIKYFDFIGLSKFFYVAMTNAIKVGATLLQQQPGVLYINLVLWHEWQVKK